MDELVLDELNQQIGAKVLESNWINPGLKQF